MQFEDLAVRFQCVAAQIETASARWFSRGERGGRRARVVRGARAAAGAGDRRDALPRRRSGPLDPGVAGDRPRRADGLRPAGRPDRARSAAPRWPWEVGLVAFEIARRYRFNEDLERVPEGVAVHVLPSGSERSPSMTMSYRGARQVSARIEAASVATRGYLAGLESEARGEALGAAVLGTSGLPRALAADGRRADGDPAAVLRRRGGGGDLPRAAPAAARRVVRHGLPVDGRRDAVRVLVAVVPATAAEPGRDRLARTAYGAAPARAAGSGEGVAVDGGVPGGRRRRAVARTAPAADDPRPHAGPGTR